MVAQQINQKEQNCPTCEHPLIPYGEHGATVCDNMDCECPCAGEQLKQIKEDSISLSELQEIKDELKHRLQPPDFIRDIDIAEEIDKAFEKVLKK